MKTAETNTLYANEHHHNPELAEYPGDKALQIIKECREAMGDEFSVVPLQAEFGDLFSAPEFDDCYLALADANHAHTFKARGGIVAVWDAVLEHDAQRVAAVSAGNHAAGVALATEILGVECDIFVPTATPPEKIENIRKLNAKAIIHQVGASFEETKALAADWESQRTIENAATFIDPYDDPVVVAGQGTLVDDILAERPNVKTIVLPIGGGGLAAGLQLRLNQLGRQDILLVIVEAPGSDSSSKSLQAGHIVDATFPNARYGGSCVLRTGKISHATRTDNPQQRTVSTNDQQIEQFMRAYLEQKPDDGQEPYEPTSCVTFVGFMHAVQSGELILNGETVVLGTGRNAKIPQL